MIIKFVFLLYVLLSVTAIILYLPRLNGFKYAFKKLPHKEATAKRKIAVVVPARNESKVIGDLFDSIAQQDYDNFDVFVIVEDEADPTIELANKAGAKTIVVKNQKCKGDALEGFFNGQELDYDAFVIVDADGVLSPNYLTELNNALEYDYDIFVTRKLAKNFLVGREYRSVFSNCSALTWPFIDDLSNAYRTKKGMPLNICGQGLMIRRHVIEEIGGWPYKTMTEDYELKLDSLLRGYKSAYYSYASLYTEEALSHRDSYKRRVRWLAGYKQCDRKYKKSIKAKVKSEKKLGRAEREYFYGLVPYIIFLVTTILTVISGITLACVYSVNGSELYLAAIIKLIVLPIAILYGLLLLYTLLALIAAHDSFNSITFHERVFMAVFNPIYILEYIFVYFAALKKLRRSDLSWDGPSRGKKQSKRELADSTYRELEINGQFDKEVIPYGDRWTMPDANYKYRQPWYEKIVTGFYRSLLSLITPIYLSLVFGAKVKGKKNLRAIKGMGAITICNHFSYLDTLFVRRAIGQFGSFHTMAPFNNKEGIGGHIIRHGGMWPLSADLSAMRNLSDEMQRQLGKGKKVNFYPEQAMWWNYRKPRPMKDGAFHYAVKFNVPVLPVFCTFKRNKRGKIRKLRINILPAIFPDSRLNRRERVAGMRTEAEREWKDCYESAYNQPLVYENAQPIAV